MMNGDLALWLKYLPEEGNPVSHSVCESKFQSVDQCKIFGLSGLPHLFAITAFFLWNTLQLIREFMSRQVLTIQTLSQNLYCLRNLPIGGASIEHNTKIWSIIVFNTQFKIVGNMIDCRIGIKCLNHWQMSGNRSFTFKTNTITGWVLVLTTSVICREEDKWCIQHVLQKFLSG